MPRITYEINENDSNQRLDKFAKKLLIDTPLAGIYKMIRSKDIVVNGKKSEQDYVLQQGDSVRIFHREDPTSTMVDNSRQNNVEDRKPDSERKNYSFRSMIIYEDEDFVCINKPPHLNVHPWDHKTKEVSLIELALDYYQGKYNSLTFKPSLVHRIDRQTTGCVLIAKNKPTLDALLALLQSQQIEKIYHTITIENSTVKSRDTIRSKLERYDGGGGSKVRVSEVWEPSVTHYSTLKNLSNKYRLIECRLETGRMHQIRVHLSSIGLPIVGDGYYGEKWENSFAKRAYSIDHQLLHAYRLSFEHPRTHQPLNIIAPYPKDFEKFIESVTNS